MKNCLMTTISAGLWLESLEMHCKSFQCKYFIKCKTPDWIFYQLQLRSICSVTEVKDNKNYSE